MTTEIWNLKQKIITCIVDLNSIQDTSESGETITWTNVGEEADIFFVVRFEEKYFRLSQICLSGK
jgi:hypothetical protein